MCCAFLSKVLLNQLIKEVAQGKKAVESQSNKWHQQKRTYQFFCSKIVILLWCDSLQSFKAIAFMVHRVLILNILRHLFKNKEICTLDRLCGLIIKTVNTYFWMRFYVQLLVTFILLTQGREFCMLIFVAVFLILFNVQF